MVSLKPFLVNFELNSMVRSNGRVFCPSSDGRNSNHEVTVGIGDVPLTSPETAEAWAVLAVRTTSATTNGLMEDCMSLGELLVGIVVIFSWGG